MNTAWACALVAGCGFGATPGGAIPDGALADGRAEVSPDAPLDAPDAKCFGSGAFYLCLDDEPTEARTFVGPFDTTACNTQGAAPRDLGGTSVCVIAGATITNDTFVGVFGDRPLVLVATGDIAIAGAIDAASRRDKPAPGPGANPAACGGGAGGVFANGTGGGGAGGSFGTAGGAGGDGGGAGATGATAKPAATQPVATLRGGCPGGDGGSPNLTRGGAGGGAVYVVARGTIDVTGLINVSGSGGQGGIASKGGGAGGGAGGMLVLHAGTLTLGSNARLVANGGGGGGGSGQNGAFLDGASPNPFEPSAAAAGGTNGGMGGTARGGDGAARDLAAQPGTAGNNGGGGGGGGAGVIRVLAGHANPASIPGGTASPQPRT